MTDNSELNLIDTVCTTIDNNDDITTAPTINKNQKEDTQHHPKQKTQLHRLTPSELYQIDRRAFNKSYVTTLCPHCGHQHPISRYELHRLRLQHYRQWSHSLNYKLNNEQRKLRASKAGTQRAINAGQKLRKNTNVQEGVLVD